MSTDPRLETPHSPRALQTRAVVAVVAVVMMHDVNSERHVPIALILIPYPIMKVLLLSGDFIEDYELYAPLQALEMLGIDVHIVCPDKKPGEMIQTALHILEPGRQTYSERPGHPFDITHDFDAAAADLAQYAGLVVPGGRFPEYQRYDKRVLDVIRYFMGKNRPVAALCHGLQLLAAADVIRGRSCSAFPMCKLDVEAAGAKYIDYEALSKNVYVDDNLVSAPAYPAIGVWLKAFIKLLGVRVELP